MVWFVSGPFHHWLISFFSNNQSIVWSFKRLQTWKMCTGSFSDYLSALSGTEKQYRLTLPSLKTSHRKDLFSISDESTGTRMNWLMNICMHVNVYIKLTCIFTLGHSRVLQRETFDFFPDMVVFLDWSFKWMTRIIVEILSSSNSSFCLGCWSLIWYSRGSTLERFQIDFGLILRALIKNGHILLIFRRTCLQAQNSTPARECRIWVDFYWPV